MADGQKWPPLPRTINSGNYLLIQRLRMKYNIHSFLRLIGVATAVFNYRSKLRIARIVSDKFRMSAGSEFRATTAVVPVYGFSSPKAVSERAKTFAFRRRKHGEFTINRGIYFLYQEWQRILIPIYLSQQFTNYNAHQFAKQSYRPELLIDEHGYLNFHDILVKFFIH